MEVVMEVALGLSEKNLNGLGILMRSHLWKDGRTAISGIPR